MKTIRQSIYKIILTAMVLGMSSIPEAMAMKFYRIVLPSGNTRVFDSRSINGIDYTSMRQLSNLIAYGGKYHAEKFTMESRGIKLRTLPGSFFIVLETDESTKIAQMLLPVLLSKKDILLPIQTFFQSLQTLGLYNVDIAGNTIHLKSDKYDVLPKHAAPAIRSHPKRIREANEPDLEKISSRSSRRVTNSDEDDSKIHRSNVHNSKTENKEHSTENSKNDTEHSESEHKAAGSETKQFREPNKPTPPDKYILPEKLKRDEVESAHKKKH